MTSEWVRKFWMRVSRRGIGECWPWLAGKASTGYGRVYLHEEKRVEYVHRVVVFLKTGVWPVCALHSCDNPPCCNPAHLRAGTHKENMADCVNRKRLRPGKRHPSRNKLARAKLDRDAIGCILGYLADGISVNAIAAKFSVTRRAIYTILEGRRWKPEVAAFFCV